MWMCDITFSSLYGMDYDSFVPFLKDAVPQMMLFDTIRI